MDAKLKRRDPNLEEALRLREEEWKSRWGIREQELSEELKVREDAFILDQLKRDSEVIKIIKEMEDSMEKNLLQKANAFRYLYKEHHKEIRLLIEKRDKEMEGNLNYREKCWNESLDMINNNLLKVYSAQGEFEGTLNSIRQRQNDLIKQLALTMECSVLNINEEGSRSKQPQVQILEFSNSTAGYKFEPVNLHHSHRHERRINSLPCSSFPFSLFVPNLSYMIEFA